MCPDDADVTDAEVNAQVATSQVATSQVATSQGKSPRVAVVADDDEVARNLLKEVLIACGLHVDGEAADGKQALAEVKRLRPDVVCLDIDMPMMSGLDVLARVRGSNDKMIALIVTASPTAQNVREAIKAGADGVIAKPFNREKIASEIERAAARKKLKR